MTTYTLSDYKERISIYYAVTYKAFDKPWYTYKEITTWPLFSYIVRDYYKANGKELHTKDQFDSFVEENKLEFYYDLNHILSQTDKKLKIKEL